MRPPYRAESGNGYLVDGRGRWRRSVALNTTLHDHLQWSVSDPRVYGIDHGNFHCSTPVGSRKPFSPHGLVGPTSHWALERGIGGERPISSASYSASDHEAYPTLTCVAQPSSLAYAGPIVQATLSSWPHGPDSTMALGGRRRVSCSGIGNPNRHAWLVVQDGPQDCASPCSTER